jgi:pentatricopeptide repeat protein
LLAVTKLFKEMVNNGIAPNQVSYCTLISFHYKIHAWITCWEIFEVAKKQGLVDLLTYTVMMRICRFTYEAEKSVALFKEASQLYQLNTTPPYNAHISALATSTSTSAEALDVWKLMKSKGLVPDAFTFEHVMNAISNLGKVDDAEQLLREMELYKIPINSDVSRYLLSTYANAVLNDKSTQKDKILYKDKAMKHLEQMEKENICISANCLNSLLQLYCYLGDIEAARNLVFSLMLKHRIAANSTTYLILMSAYTENESYQKALEIYSQIKSMTSISNRAIGFAFISAMMTNATDSQIALYDKARKLKISPSIAVLVALKSMNKIDNKLLVGLNKYIPSINIGIKDGNPTKNIENLIQSIRLRH